MSKSKNQKIRVINDQGEENFLALQTWGKMPVGPAGDRFGWFAADVKQDSRPVANAPAQAPARRGRPANEAAKEPAITANAQPAEDVNSD